MMSTLNDPKKLIARLEAAGWRIESCQVTVEGRWPMWLVIVQRGQRLDCGQGETLLSALQSALRTSCLQTEHTL